MEYQSERPTYAKERLHPSCLRSVDVGRLLRVINTPPGLQRSPSQMKSTSDGCVPRSDVAIPSFGGVLSLFRPSQVLRPRVAPEHDTARIIDFPILNELTMYHTKFNVAYLLGHIRYSHPTPRSRLRPGSPSKGNCTRNTVPP